MNIFASICQSFASEIREINARYSKPSIRMTPLVKVCLMSLRLYLFLLIGLLVYKFVTVVSQ